MDQTGPIIVAVLCALCLAGIIIWVIRVEYRRIYGWLRAIPFPRFRRTQLPIHNGNLTQSTTDTFELTTFRHRTHDTTGLPQYPANALTRPNNPSAQAPVPIASASGPVAGIASIAAIEQLFRYLTTQPQIFADRKRSCRERVSRLV